MEDQPNVIVKQEECVKMNWIRDREELGPYWVTRVTGAWRGEPVFQWYPYVYEDVLRDAQRQGQLQIVRMSFRLPRGPRRKTYPEN